MSTPIYFHIDMNAFFASVEQALNPAWQGRPVAVVSSVNYANAAILARSYEAKDKGVKNMSRLSEARAVCPELLITKPRHHTYYKFNLKLYEIMLRYTPKVEVYSIDEFFLDMTNYFKLHPQRSLKNVVQEIKQSIAEEISPAIRCSVGVSCNKLLAKVGSDYQKPDGFTVIPWEDRYAFLDELELGDIWGIGWRSAHKLRELGITNTRHLREADVTTLRNLVGSYWTRLKLIADGEWIDPVAANKIDKPKQSMQHAHTLSRATSDIEELKTLIRKLSEKLAFRLRGHGQMAGKVSLGIRPARETHYGWGTSPRHFGIVNLGFFTNHGEHIYRGAVSVLQELNLQGTEVRLAAVTVHHLVQDMQFNLGEQDVLNRVNPINHAMDKINGKFGAFTLTTADIIHQLAKHDQHAVTHANIPFHPN